MASFYVHETQEINQHGDWSHDSLFLQILIIMLILILKVGLEFIHEMWLLWLWGHGCNKVSINLYMRTQTMRLKVSSQSPTVHRAGVMI